MKQELQPWRWLAFLTLLIATQAIVYAGTARKRKAIAAQPQIADAGYAIATAAKVMAATALPTLHANGKIAFTSDRDGNQAANRNWLVTLCQ